MLSTHAHKINQKIIIRNSNFAKHILEIITLFFNNKFILNIRINFNFYILNDIQ